jgi:phosphotransferase system enzyme I (PtsI)
MAGPPEQPRREVTLQGIGVSPGIAVGDVFLFKTEDDRPVEREIAAEEIPREIARFEESLIETRRQIHEIQKQVGSAIGQENASIFDAHLLVVDDRSFVEEVIRGLGLQHKNVETVLRVVADKYAQALLRVEDDYLRERAADVRDVTRRILRNLVGQVGMTLDQIPAPCLLVANDLAPSEAAMLSKSKVTGFATDLGSPTSHTAIMARALRIPAVVGLHDVSSRLQHGDRVLIDGTKGVLVVNPSTALLERYGHVAEVRRSIETSLARLRLEPAETLDGYRLLLSANIELPSDVEAVLASGAAGVGLFRSEYLYLSSKGLPSEDEQTEAYAQVAQRLHPEPAIIRTLDLGGDKFASQLKTPQEMNPFMGWRAIRFCLAQPDIFKTQLRALLRASVSDNLKIMYPMVSNLDEVLRANEMLEECKRELIQRGLPFNPDLEVGVMIEIPSAALTAHLIAPHVDFFSLGTNDLVQYTLAVDRVNERIAYLYQPTHPAIIRLIKETVDAAHAHGIWAGLCGEMGGNPLMTPLLMGLGVDEISVSPSQVPLVKDVIRKMRYGDAEALAASILSSPSAVDVLQRCRAAVEKAAPEVLELVG